MGFKVFTMALLPLRPAGWRISTKLLTAFLLTAVLPALATSVFSLTYFYGVVFENARTNLDKELGVARHYVREAELRLESDARLASHENVVALNLSLGLVMPVLDYLEGLRRERSLHLVLLLDAEGCPVEPSGLTTAKGSHPLVNREVLVEAQEKGGSSFVGSEDGKVLLLALAPVNDGLTTTHFLLMGLDPSSMETGELLDNIRQVVSGPVVIGSSGRLTGSNPGAPDWDTDWWPRNLRFPAELVTVESQGTRYLFGFTGLGGTPDQPLAWLGVSFSLDGFQRATEAATMAMLLVALICLLMTFAAAFLLSRGLTRPLLLMARQASAWTEGQGGKRLDVTTQDEIGVLGRSFNEVLDRLDGTLYSLRKTQNYLKNIFNSLTSVLVSIDEGALVQEWNVAAVKFTGVAESEALGRPVGSLSPAFEGLNAALQIAIATREPQLFKKVMGRGSEARMLDLCLYPLVWNGVSGVVIRLDDITDSVKKDRQLQQAQKMETVGTLTEGIAHNFNNLLTGITGVVSLLELELSQDGHLDPKSVRHRVAMIENSTQKASEIVRRLMALSRGSSGEFETVDLVLLVKETAKTSRMVLENTVEVDIETLPASALVYGDRSQLEQSLLNLIINAAHAMTFMKPRGENRGGVVHLTLGLFTAANDFLLAHPGALQSDYWLLRVQDNGVGIRPENLSKIFDPFFTTKENEKGSGLGLAMVYSSVRQHNGFIDVYSEMGRGTTFSLYLPAHRAVTPSVKGLAAPATLHRGQGLILVVDDEAVVLQTAQLILEACGYQVVTATNGLDALDVYDAHAKKVRAVILDSAMPKLSGAATLEALRKRDPHVKVVMSSGLLDQVQAGETTPDSHLRFLPKPYSLTDLSRVLADLLAVTPGVN